MNQWKQFLRSNRVLSIWGKMQNGVSTEWNVTFMAFFKKALNDLEVKIRFYDVTDGKRFVAGDSIMTPSRGQRVLSSSMVLERGQGFVPNKKYVMTLAGRQNELLASTSFYLRGRNETYSGKVTFTDKETRGN
jgi:hypothetical protein